jgi:hypothetical protein
MEHNTEVLAVKLQALAMDSTPSLLIKMKILKDWCAKLIVCTSMLATRRTRVVVAKGVPFVATRSSEGSRELP